MANRLHSSRHALMGTPMSSAARKKDGIKNRGIAKLIKEIKRDEAIERQQQNIDRGGYLCTSRGCNPATQISIQELNTTDDVKRIFDGNAVHAHTPKPLKSQIRTKGNEPKLVANF